MEHDIQFNDPDIILDTGGGTGIFKNKKCTQSIYNSDTEVTISGRRIRIQL